MPDAPAPLRLESVGKRYGNFWGVRDVTLTIDSGESVALIGPNGAGKSTLVSLICGIRRPTTGSLFLFGRSPSRAEARETLGVAPQANALPEMLRVREVVELVARHYRRARGVDDLLETLGLGQVKGRYCGSLSGGQRRRTMLALALIGNPRLLVLDEPTAGLDAEARQAFWQQLAEYRSSGGALVLTSHYVEEAERMCDSAVVIAGGRVVEHATLDELRAHYGVSKVHLDTGESAARLRSLGGVVRVTRTGTGRGGGRHELVTSDSDLTVSELVRAGIAFTGLQVDRASLEDVIEQIVPRP